MNDSNKSLRALHDLIATCNDAAEGYRKAAKGARDKDLSNWLAQIADDRQQYGTDLAGAIANPGSEPTVDLHEGGIFHRGWLDLEQSVRPKDDNEIIRECVAGDAGTLKHYDHALMQTLQDDIRSTLLEQRTAVEGDISALEHRFVRHS